jgi:hypothetical protein
MRLTIMSCHCRSRVPAGGGSREEALPPGCGAVEEVGGRVGPWQMALTWPPLAGWLEDEFCTE